MLGEIDRVNFKPRKVASNVWRGIIKALPITNVGMKKLVLSGISTCFWRDIWLTDCPFLDVVLVDIDLVESYKLVCDLGSWFGLELGCCRVVTTRPLS